MGGAEDAVRHAVPLETAAGRALRARTDTGGHLAAQWLAAWNGHDLEQILEHYADDVVFVSPFVPELTGDPSGVIRGKDGLRAYFEAALARFPELRFTEPRVFTGAGSVSLVYRSVRELEASETMLVGEDGRIERVHAHYRPLAGAAIA